MHSTLPNLIKLTTWCEIILKNTKKYKHTKYTIMYFAHDI